MLDESAVKEVWTLMRVDLCLGVDATMNFIEVENPFAQAFRHLIQKKTQSISFPAPLNSRDTAVLDSEPYGVIKVG